MRRPPLFVACLLCWLSLPAAPARSDDVWRTDYESAQADAARLGRPLLLHFHAEWCGPCKRMEREVLRTPAVLETLESAFVAVQIDGDRRPDLTRRFSVRALPSDLIVAPKSGRVLSRSEGYREAGTYRATARRIAARFEQSQKTRLAADDHPNAEPPSSRMPAAAGPIELGAPEPMIGLDGYCPVTLAKDRTWTKGRPEFAATFKGITYHLATTEERSAFDADPRRYAPRLLGCDPVVLWDTDRAVAGSTQFGAFFDGRLYLFVSDQSRQRFKASPTRYTHTLHALRIDQIERTVLR